MTPLQITQALALSGVTFPVGSFDKRVSREWAGWARNTPDRVMTLEGSVTLGSLHHTYRRQIPQHEAHCVLCTPILRREPLFPPHIQALLALMGDVPDTYTRCLRISEALSVISEYAELGAVLLKRTHNTAVLKHWQDALTFWVPETSLSPEP